MAFQQRKFIDCKLYLGKEITFKDRIDMTTHILTSKELTMAIQQKEIPLWFKNEYGELIQIGYMTDFKGKLTAKSVGNSSCYIFADFYLTTSDDYILDLAWKYVDSHKNKYRLSFKKEKFFHHGMIIEFNV